MEFRIVYFPELASTNDEASSAKYCHGDVIMCGYQTKGRGQRGNGWHSRLGENLTFSIVTEPKLLKAENNFLLSQSVSLALCDALGSFGIRSAIKWPNDIYADDRKLAGILIENDILGANLSRSVIGVGLNVNQTVFPPELPNPVSIANLTGRTICDPGEVLDRILGFFKVRYGAVFSVEGMSALECEYGKRLYKKGEETSFRYPNGELFRGVIEGVLSDGSLRVRTETGRYELFRFKEVEFVLPSESGR